ncbi:hypothetical protein C3L33_04277, partial [Rhododendron williamsianum]
MAALHSLAFSSPVSHCPRQTPFLSAEALGLVTVENSENPIKDEHKCMAVGGLGAVHRSTQSSFSGQPLRLQNTYCTQRRSSQVRRLGITMMVKPTIQFIKGTDEQTIPDVKLTKSKDGTNGMALFSFEQPSVFDSSGEVGDITGFYMIDEEGVLQSVDVSAKFVNGKPSRIEAKYVMRTPKEWDRFMRFMERYANVNGLQFVKK